MNKYLLLLLLLFLWDVAHAQRTITGQVTSELYGESLPGVNILVEGTTIGTITDIDGNYQSQVPDEAETLSFSFIGYESVKKQIGTQSVINVVLIEDIQSLSEVIVVGYG